MNVGRYCATETPIEPVPVAVGLGSNLGDREANLNHALAELRRVIDDLRCSGFLANPPVESPPEAGEFLNAVAVGWTRLSPRALFAAMQRIEAKLGRPNDHAYHAPRCIDLDLLLYGEATIDEPDLKVPHPELQKRDFVYLPLAEVAPDWPPRKAFVDRD